MDPILPYEIVKLGRRLDRFFEGLMTEEGLSVRQWGMLTQFAGSPAITAADLARRIEVTPQSIAPHVDALVGQGLVARKPIPGRGRPVELSLTDEGKRVLKRALGAAARAQDELMRHMSAADRAQMLTWVQGIDANLEDNRPV